MKFFCSAYVYRMSFSCRSKWDRPWGNKRPYMREPTAMFVFIHGIDNGVYFRAHRMELLSLFNAISCRRPSAGRPTHVSCWPSVSQASDVKHTSSVFTCHCSRRRRLCFRPRVQCCAHYVNHETTGVDWACAVPRGLIKAACFRLWPRLMSRVTT